jgi:predicted DNA-binding antitoxin AbrB/MazE fold protein
MERIEAVFEGGVFRPLEGVALPERQLVRLSVEPIATPDPMAWLDRVREHHRQVFERRGPLPDSTADIAEDRERDV